MNSEWLVGLGRGLRSSRARFWLIPLLFVLPGVAFASTGGGGEIPALSERMMLLVIQLGIILFAARIGGKLFERMKLPGVLGELCIGIIIGPSLLGGIPVPILTFLNAFFPDLTPSVRCATFPPHENALQAGFLRAGARAV